MKNIYLILPYFLSFAFHFGFSHNLPKPLTSGHILPLLRMVTTKPMLSVNQFNGTTTIQK